MPRFVAQNREKICNIAHHVDVLNRPLTVVVDGMFVSASESINSLGCRGQLAILGSTKIKNKKIALHDIQLRAVDLKR